MKRVLLFCFTVVLLLTTVGCQTKLPQSEMENTTKEFMVALQSYDRAAMSVVLSAFPDNTPYVYVDDIFNDPGYVEMYRLLFKDISYRVVGADKNGLTVEVTMPNVQELYVRVMGVVFQMALTNPELEQKLGESSENGSVLVREIMLDQVKRGQVPQSFTEEFILSFGQKDGQTVICCDDTLRTLMTGKFFLSKNTTIQ